jgi:hypothetical protein
MLRVISADVFEVVGVCPVECIGVAARVLLRVHGLSLSVVRDRAWAWILS